MSRDLDLILLRKSLEFKYVFKVFSSSIIETWVNMLQMYSVKRGSHRNAVDKFCICKGVENNIQLIRYNATLFSRPFTA